MDNDDATGKATPSTKFCTIHGIKFNSDSTIFTHRDRVISIRKQNAWSSTKHNNTVEVNHAPKDPLNMTNATDDIDDYFRATGFLLFI